MSGHGIDLFSGRLIGWSIADHHRAELVRDARAAAVAARGGDVALAINKRPRKILGWRTPAEVFQEQLNSISAAGAAA